MQATQVTRGFNEVFQISQGADAFVQYSVDISCSVSLSGGQTGTVYLDIADNYEFTDNVYEMSRAVNSNTGTLTLGLNNTQIVTANLTGTVLSNHWLRIRTEQNTGSPTFTFRAGQETTF